VRRLVIRGVRAAVAPVVPEDEAASLGERPDLARPELRALAHTVGEDDRIPPAVLLVVEPDVARAEVRHASAPPGRPAAPGPECRIGRAAGRGDLLDDPVDALHLPVALDLPEVGADDDPAELLDDRGDVVDHQVGLAGTGCRVSGVWGRGSGIRSPRRPTPNPQPLRPGARG